MNATITHITVIFTAIYIYHYLYLPLFIFATNAISTFYHGALLYWLNPAKHTLLQGHKHLYGAQEHTL